MESVAREEAPREVWRPLKKVIGRSVIKTPDNMLLTGRYGAWDKSKLSHDAYLDVKAWLS